MDAIPPTSPARRPPAARLLQLAIVALAAWLNFANLAAIGDGNLYYTAAVESMLDGWHNFFYVAAEPGGSVSIDKPPLGLWIETASAALFGVNGLAVVLPNILAGLAAVAIVYRIVSRRYGTLGGVSAALALAVTPVAIAAQRNNTADGLLTLLLLLAAWGTLRAAETGRARPLWLAALAVGLGFMTKMLQAYLVLPALTAVYLLGAPVAWRRKLRDLTIAGAIVLVVSAWWPLAVDLTPATQRPYVGSSSDNTMLSLIVGYNGVQRLTGLLRGGGAPGGAPLALPAGNPAAGNPAAGDPAAGDPAAGDPLARAAAELGISAQALAEALGDIRPGSGGAPDFEALAATLGVDAAALEAALAAGAPGGGVPPGGGVQPGGPSEVGTAGPLRFWRAPLSKELSWLLLPALLALAGLLLRGDDGAAAAAAGANRRAAVLWGGWLLTGLLFFSVAGFFHAYYLVMLAPPLAVLVGIGVARLATLTQQQPAVGLALTGGRVGVTLAYQWYNATQFGGAPAWLLGVTLGAAAGGLTLALWAGRAPAVRVRARSAGVTLLMATGVLLPLYWSAQTTLTPANTTLPAAWGGPAADAAPFAPFAPGAFGAAATDDDALLALLTANTQGVRYLAAVPSSMQGAPLVLASGRPVLYIGGFNGSDRVIDAAGLAALVAAGELRYVLTDGARADDDISAWAAQACVPVDAARGLFDCRPDS